MFVAETFAYTSDPQAKFHGRAVNAMLGIAQVLEMRTASVDPSQY